MELVTSFLSIIAFLTINRIIPCNYCHPISAIGTMINTTSQIVTFAEGAAVCNSGDTIVQKNAHIYRRTSQHYFEQ